MDGIVGREAKPSPNPEATPIPHVVQLQNASKRHFRIASWEDIPEWLVETIDFEAQNGETAFKIGNGIRAELSYTQKNFVDFDSFYSENIVERENALIEHDAPEGHHSVWNLIGKNSSEAPLNCLGEAIYTSAVGEVCFEKNFEAVIEYRDETFDPETGMTLDPKSHVYLRDASESAYGPTHGYDNVEVHSPQVLSSLYRLTDAFIEYQKGNIQAAREIGRTVENPCGSTYVAERASELF